MPGKNVFRYYLKLWFSTLEEPVVIRVGKDDMERFRRNYEGARDSFFVTETDVGTHVAINLRQVELANLLWDAGLWEDSESEHEGDWITFYTRNREPIHADIGEPGELAHALFILESESLTCDGAVSFTDADGELLMFDPHSLLYLEVPSGIVAEGQAEMLEEFDVDMESVHSTSGGTHAVNDSRLKRTLDAHDHLGSNGGSAGGRPDGANDREPWDDENVRGGSNTNDDQNGTAEVLDFKTEKLRRKTTWEHCVTCDQRTTVQRTEPIQNRSHYVEGVGQLCADCYHDTQD